MHDKSRLFKEQTTSNKLCWFEILVFLKISVPGNVICISYHRKRTSVKHEITVKKYSIYWQLRWLVISTFGLTDYVHCYISIDILYHQEHPCKTTNYKDRLQEYRMKFVFTHRPRRSLICFPVPKTFKEAAKALSSWGGHIIYYRMYSALHLARVFFSMLTVCDFCCRKWFMEPDSRQTSSLSCGYRCSSLD